MNEFFHLDDSIAPCETLDVILPPGELLSNKNSWMNNYPKIYNINDRVEVASIFDDEVVIQEKIDGSQISFGVFDNVLIIKSKNKELDLNAPEKLFSKAIDYIISIKDRLRVGCIYRGEYLKEPLHNRIKYNRVPNNNIIIFDINYGKNIFVSYDNVLLLASDIGLEVVPLLFSGNKESAGFLEKLFVGNKREEDFLEKLMDKESCLGGAKMEGIVIKNYHRFDKQGRHLLMAKLVSESFEEIKKCKRKLHYADGNKDIIFAIAQNLKTEARWYKGIQTLREKGELTDSVQDIGNIIKEINKDLMDECSEYISQKLLEWGLPKILKGATAGFPEWYKKLLLDSFMEK